MKRVVIIGNSMAGVKVIQELLTASNEFSFTIICTHGKLPCNRNLFPELVNKTIALDDVFYKTEAYYQKHKIQIINEAKITRVNLKRKKVYCDDKQHLDYDILIFSDTPDHKFPEIKGNNKKGLFGLRKLTDVQQIQDELPLCETIAIQSNSMYGLKIALALAERNKEVVLISSLKGIGVDGLGNNDTGWILDWLRNKGVAMILENEIVEVLGDGYAKAVRLKSGKVLASQMVLFENIYEDFRFLNETDVIDENKIRVNDYFETKVNDVFALDCVTQTPVQNYGDVLPEFYLEEQSLMVSSKLLNKEREAYWPQLNQRIYHKEGSLIFSGALNHTNFLEKNDSENKRYLKVFLYNDQIQGYILINADSEEEKIQKLMQQGVTLSPTDQFVLDSQLSFEQIIDKLQQGSKISEEIQAESAAIVPVGSPQPDPIHHDMENS
ncbi:MAG: FAD-dependent oxidoreductase [Candidatus Omnitrophica bacterium]|nr:FAD-dependent oxidoreductase [Candidatus Omnitrophota bacterium]